LDRAFFEKLFRKRGGREHVNVVSVSPLEEVSDSSILSRLTLDQSRKLIGVFPYKITGEDGGAGFEEKVLVKIKPSDRDVLAMGNGMARLSGSERLIQLYNLFQKNIEFYRSHLRELAVYSIEEPRLRRYFPKILAIEQDEHREFYCIVMEYLGGCSHLDSENDPSLWRDEDIRIVLQGMAEIHSVHFNRPPSTLESLHLVVPGSKTVRDMGDFWRELTDVNNYMHPDLITEDRWRMLHAFIDSRPEEWERIEATPRTLIHNDFNPRNLCIRDAEQERRLCLYDWELATYHVPQRDLAEFLAYVFPSGTGPDRYVRYVDFFRSELQRRTGSELDPDAFLEMFRIAMKDLAVTRMNLYLMAHNFKQYDFLNRVVPNIMEYLEKAD
jgi:aminoglycoside phosphotransferase (APT) family kinase protein